MLMHAAVNNIGDIVPAATPGAHDVFGPPIPRRLDIGGLSWLVAFACLSYAKFAR